MWKGKGRSGYGESSTLGDYDDWSCLSRNGKQWKNPVTMETRDLSGADYWHIRKQLTDSYDVPEELHAVNETVSLAHTLPSGKANLAAYADPVTTNRATKVPLKNRILPQAVRVEKLRAEILELEQAYRSGEFNLQDYSLYRDVAFKKLRRAEELLKRAVKPVEKVEVEEEIYANSFSNSSDNNGHGESYSSPVGVEFIDELSDQNSFKSFLKMSCRVVRKAVQLSQAARNYINELKAI